PTRLRTSAPTPTPMAANAAFQATPPASVRHSSGAERSSEPPRAASQMAEVASATPDATTAQPSPAAVYTQSLARITRPRRGVATGGREVRVGDGAVPVLPGHRDDAQHEREQRGQADMRGGAGRGRAVVDVAAAQPAAGAQEHDQLGGAEQEPGAAGGPQLEQ